MTRLGDSYPWAAGQSSLCALSPASSPGGTGLTAGLDPGCGCTDAAGVGWGKETRSGGWREIRKPVDDGQALGMELAPSDQGGRQRRGGLERQTLSQSDPWGCSGQRRGQLSGNAGVCGICSGCAGW